MNSQYQPDTTQSRKGSLTETERWLLINALNVAAERYEMDARNDTDFEMSERSVKGFKDQAKSARAWAKVLEETEEIILK